MPLTEVKVRNAKGRAIAYKLADSGALYLLVRPDGARYWRMDYRWHGKRRTLALGVYPAVTLSEARTGRDLAKKQLASGTDPVAQRRCDKIASKAASDNTFRLVSEEWIAKLEREGRAVATLNKIRWLLAQPGAPGARHRSSPSSERRE
jgi:hypothetical protein